MNRYRNYGALDDQPELIGDAGFSKLDMLTDPAMQSRMMALGLVLALLWFLYMKLPLFIRSEYREVRRLGKFHILAPKNAPSPGAEGHLAAAPEANIGGM